MKSGFGVTVRLVKTTERLVRATQKGKYKTLRHAGFSIAKSARESMVRAKGPSPPGTPPHVHTGRLRGSILVGQDEGKDEVVVGPSYSRVKRGGRPPWLAEMLEKGGTFQRKKKRKRKAGRDIQGRFLKSTEAAEIAITTTYPARPFMHPALMRNLARFRADWEGAIG